ncbi:MAG: PASTA domain-containing protein [Pseudoflavonifractor sp.]|nr:PASTA domain-containing protein [Alloprevotella sp.]MCM1117465.1 PASTA domain-containing protein [Pseudoflavonifractor sp.]
MTEEKPQKKAGKGESPFWRALLINLCCIIAAGFAIVWLALSWLGIWTAHGDETQIPPVTGMSYNAAAAQLEGRGFHVELLDSVYDTTKAPGTVTDQSPKEGSTVKSGREVYLTITAFTPKMVGLPKVTDVSERQARAMLMGIGINSISTVVVPGEYKDLVMGMTVDGRRAAPGMRVPVTSRVTLEVSSGPVNELVDSLAHEAEARAEEAEGADIFDPDRI